MPEPSHPLTTRRRSGVVTAITSGPPPTVTVQIGGDDGTALAAGDQQQIPLLDSYYPTVGDTVTVLQVGGDHIAIGTPALNTTPYLSIGWAGHTINSGANQVSFSTTDPWGGWDGTNNWWVVPRRGLYQVSAVWRYNAVHAVSAADLFVNGSRLIQSPFDTGAVDTGPQYHITASFAVGDQISIRAVTGGVGANFANYMTITEVGRL